ncbi:MAG: GIY-YIG nuclease family protein [Clostridiales bacterium]|nr:GIY-YIG nuclease family protein [Clostridiales bacterium]
MDNCKRYYTYMLECGDNSLYTGYTTDIKKRLFTHNRGAGAKYTRGRLPVKLVYIKGFETKSEAQAYEARIKRLTRIEKRRLIDGEQPDFPATVD